MRSKSRCQASKLGRKSEGTKTHHLSPGLGLGRSSYSEPVQVKQVRIGERAELDAGAFCKCREQRAGQVLLRAGAGGAESGRGLSEGGSRGSTDFI